MNNNRSLKICSEDERKMVRNKIVHLCDTQKKFAARTKVALRTISKFVNGTPISRELFIKLSNELQLDWDKLSTPKATSELENLPFYTLHYFSGREAEREELHKRLTSIKDRVEYDAIIGMWGCGKSELASDYGNRYFYKEKFYTGGVVWIDARRLDPGEQIVGFVKTKFSYESKAKEQDKRIADSYDNWGAEDEPVLLIFDDVNKWSDIEKSLPPWNRKRFKVLITSRVANIHPAIIAFELNVLELEPSVNLLCGIIGSPSTQKKYREQIDILCKRVGCLPLAIEIFGNHLKKHRHNLSRAIRQINADLKKHGLEANEFKFIPNTRAAYDISRIETQEIEAQQVVTTSLNLTWNGDTFTSDVKMVCYLISCLPNIWLDEDIIESTVPIASGLGKEKVIKLLNEVVVSNRFIQISNNGEYRYHELIRDFVRVELCQSHQKMYVKEALFSLFVLNTRSLIEQIPHIDYARWLDQLIMMLEYIYAEDQFSWYLEDKPKCEWLFRTAQGELAARISRFYSDHFLYNKSRKWKLIAERCLDKEEADLSVLYSDMAVVVDWSSYLDEAFDGYIRSYPKYNIELHLDFNTLWVRFGIIANGILVRMYEPYLNTDDLTDTQFEKLSEHRENVYKGEEACLRLKSYTNLHKGIKLIKSESIDRGLTEIKSSLRFQIVSEQKAEIFFNKVLEEGGGNIKTPKIRDNNVNIRTTDEKDGFKYLLKLERAHRQHRHQVYSTISIMFILSAIYRMIGDHNKEFDTLVNLCAKASEFFGFKHPLMTQYFCALGMVELDRGNEENARWMLIAALSSRVNRLIKEAMDIPVGCNYPGISLEINKQSPDVMKEGKTTVSISQFGLIIQNVQAALSTQSNESVLTILDSEVSYQLEPYIKQLLDRVIEVYGSDWGALQVFM